ncbi:hypothetical protein ABK040_002311 [Willaertia magna]
MSSLNNVNGSNNKIYFLGIDIGTQSMKCTVLSFQNNQLHNNSNNLDNNQNLTIEYSNQIHYDSEFPNYKTNGGVHIKEEKQDNNEKSITSVTSPIFLWLEAFEKLMKEIPLHLRKQLNYISGSAQQHGSIYTSKFNDFYDNNNCDNDYNNYLTIWERINERNLQKEEKNNFTNLFKESDFITTDCPIWMDSSTTLQCNYLEKFIGNSKELIKITGSSAFERFTASQIMKMLQNIKKKQVERICLISSFFSSLFIGKYSSIEFGDGSGMNLLDIHSLEWSDRCLDAIVNYCNDYCDNTLQKDCLQESNNFVNKKLTREKLIEMIDGSVISSMKCIGTISNIMNEFFEINLNCKVLPFTGDNLSSSNFMLRKENDLCCSLGTSHTLFGLLSENKLNQMSLKEEGHNGGLVRSEFCNKYCNGNWNIFDNYLTIKNIFPIILKDKQNIEFKINEPMIGFYFKYPEITPNTKNKFGYFRYLKDLNNNKYNLILNDKFEEYLKYSTSENIEKLKILEIQTLIYFQFLILKTHGKINGLTLNSESRLIVTGGASLNLTLSQILANVFQVPVYYSKDSQNSTTLGAIARCLYDYLLLSENKDKSYFELVAPLLSPFELLASPMLEEEGKKEEMQKMEELFEELEQDLLSKHLL